LDRQKRFLDAYRKVGTIIHAAEQSAIAARTHYTWLDKDQGYVEKFEEAHKEAIERLVAEARRRALEGVQRKKFHNGAPVLDPETGEQYMEREYSDTLLIFLLKGAMPETYRDRQDVQVTGRVDSAVRVYLPDNGREGDV
jgi:hypothetical protein